MYMSIQVNFKIKKYKMSVQSPKKANQISLLAVGNSERLPIGSFSLSLPLNPASFSWKDTDLSGFILTGCEMVEMWAFEDGSLR